jgi:DNA topoisomerase-1
MSKLSTEKFLVIVESPNKVKTVSNILKKAGYEKAIVMASVGHIMELQNGGPCFNSGIYPKEEFKMNLKVAEDKTKVVTNLKTAVKTVDKVFLMTDGDREGEVISWSLIKFLKLNEGSYFRAITHEITPKAIIHALENPVELDMNLVEAGLVRMRLDKMIGFGLSPVAKRYIGAKSVGRCQSVGLKLVSERENEILNFIPELYYNLYLNFTKNNKEFKAKYCGYNSEAIDKFTNQADVLAVMSNCNGTPFIVESVEEVKHSESPKPPFCTATFQQEAASKLGLRVKDAMSCAQKLFEGIKIDGKHVGIITYLRTDSTDIAQEFLPELKNFIASQYGAKSYRAPRKSKSKSTDQNGHEALRVVDPELTPEKLATYISNELLIKVYKLIWQRTIAAAMPNAMIAEVIYTINNNGHKFKLSSKTLVDAGYREVYNYSDNQILCCDEAFIVGEILENATLEYTKDFTEPKARYTEASLVKELQHREIGRPSTYATIVETILSPTRGYAKLEEKCIVPTDRGMQLADYCNRAFPTLINLNYTKEMEESLDKIAVGDLLLLDYMNNFYSNLKSVIDNTGEAGLAADLKEEKICPECGKVLTIKRSRFGKLFYGCDFPRCRFTESI